MCPGLMASSVRYSSLTIVFARLWARVNHPWAASVEPHRSILRPVSCATYVYTYNKRYSTMARTKRETSERGGCAQKEARQANKRERERERDVKTKGRGEEGEGIFILIYAWSCRNSTNSRQLIPTTLSRWVRVATTLRGHKCRSRLLVRSCFHMDSRAKESTTSFGRVVYRVYFCYIRR